MKKSWSILAFLGLAAVAFAAPVWADELKIGVVEPQKVLEGTKSGKKAKNSLVDYVGARQKLLDSEADDLKKIEDDLVKQGTIMSAEARQEKEEMLRQRMAVYQRRVQELEVEVQAKKAEVLGEFTKSLEEVVREIAEKEKIFLVMDKGDNGYGSLVLFSHPSVDLTDRVIKALDSRKNN